MLLLLSSENEQGALVSSREAERSVRRKISDVNPPLQSSSETSMLPHLLYKSRSNVLSNRTKRGTPNQYVRKSEMQKDYLRLVSQQFEGHRVGDLDGELLEVKCCSVELEIYPQILHCDPKSDAAVSSVTTGYTCGHLYDVCTKDSSLSC